MKLPYYVVDAFTGRVFGGNPAGVCPLERWPADTTLQAIAAENNLAETAFFVPEGEGYRLRWFTPTVEMDLCGHATLASAWVLFERLGAQGESIAFETKSGTLNVKKDGALLAMDFPARPGTRVEPPEALCAGLGFAPAEVHKARDYLVILETEAAVRALRPDLAALARLDCTGIIVSGPGTEVDFVSRFFAPRMGVPEDPVTGSSHCTLIPYWSGRLGKTKLSARQVSARGGELVCADLGERVSIAGRAALYLEGRIFAD